MDHDEADTSPPAPGDHDEIIELVYGTDTSAPDVNPVIEDDHLCMTCSYSLRGLRQSDQCPECGTLVAESLRGDMLFYRNPDYTRKLLKGLSFILNGILLQIIAMFVGGLLIGILAGAAVGAIPSSVTLFVLPALSVVISGIITIGWWWFTSQDPGVATELEPKARKIVRGAVIASVAFTLLSFVAGFLPSSLTSGIAPTRGLPPAGLSGFDVLIILIGLGSVAAWITQFFAGMLYVRGLARRLPNEKIHKRAKSRMIACPIWYTVGFLLCGLGPVIALILYWNLLNMVRTALKTIIEAQEAGQLEPPVIHIK